MVTMTGYNGLYLLSTSTQDQDAEDKQHSEPDFANHCGVALHFIQQAAQQIPFTHFSRQLSCCLIKEMHEVFTDRKKKERNTQKWFCRSKNQDRHSLA